MRRKARAKDDESNQHWFETTHWSKVLTAGNMQSSQASEALSILCQSYWSPLYSYIRRQGYGRADAQDLTQAFFAKMLGKNFWVRADPQRGRFRSFLLTALRHYLADENDRARTVKRGGGLTFISIDTEIGEAHFKEALSYNLSSEQQFERQWAYSVLENARQKLRQECFASGKLELYDKVSLIDGKGESSLSYAVIAQQLGTTVSAIKSAVYRLRERYGELVRKEIEHTVKDPTEIPDEIRHFIRVIGT